MQKLTIEFKKQRDFGEILADTFGFIRSEFKPFMSVFFNICGPFLLALLLSIGFYTYLVGDLSGFATFENDSTGFSNPFLVVMSFLAYMLSAVVAYIFSIGTTLFYIRSYIDNEGKASMEEVKNNVYRSFWSLFGLSILKGLTISFALLLCVLPVFYAMVPMAVVFSIYVFEPKKSATDAYGDSFYLVNQDFWLALGTFIVLGVIFYILSLVFSLPAIIYSFVKIGISSSEIDPSDMNSFIDPFYILLNVLSSFVQFLLNLILIIGGAFIYFHLNEKKNFTGTFERIERIGENLEE
jgi:hypothetical protein